MGLERITYVAGSASLFRLPDGTNLLLEIASNRIRLREEGRLTATLWQYSFPFTVREMTPAAKTALDIVLNSIEGAETLADVQSRLSASTIPELSTWAENYAELVKDEEEKRLENVEVKPFTSGHTRAQWTVMLLAAVVVVDVIAVLSGALEVEILDRAARGISITESEAAASDARQSLIGSLQLLLIAATAVVFLLWLHRTYSNLSAFGHQPRFSPGWAVGYWFIPILFLFRPYQVVAENWRVSNPGPRGSPLLGLWWAAFLINGFIGQASFRYWVNAGDDIARLTEASAVSMFASMVDIPAAILAILVVRGIDRRQELKHQRLVEVRKDTFLGTIRGAMAILLLSSVSCVGISDIGEEVRINADGSGSWTLRLAISEASVAGRINESTQIITVRAPLAKREAV